MEVERYLDVNEELLFRAVHFRRGAPSFKSQQAVYSIERLKKVEGGWEADLIVVRWIEDGLDRSIELGGSKLRALCRKSEQGLTIAFSELDGPRPRDLSAAEEYLKKG